MPKSTFALANLSPFQPGFGSLQIMAVHQNPSTSSTNASLVFSVTDQGDEEDLTSSSQPEFVDVSPELVSLCVEAGFLSLEGKLKKLYPSDASVTLFRAL